MDNDEVMLLQVDCYTDNSFDSDRFIKMIGEIMHDGSNKNNTIFTKESMDNAKESCQNIPILAHVVFDNEGKPHFGGHDKHTEMQDDGKQKVIYDEVPIGLVPESTNYEVYQTKSGQYRVRFPFYIWRGYSNYAEDVILNKGKTKLSMEVILDSTTFDKDSKKFTVNAYRYRGITFLGENRNPAMTGANASVVYEENITETYEKIKQLLEMELANFEKGGNGMDNEQMLEQEEGKDVAKEVFDNETKNENIDSQDQSNVLEVENEQKDDSQVQENFENLDNEKNDNVDDENVNETEDIKPSQEFETYRELRDKLEKALDNKSHSEPYHEEYYYLYDFDDKYVFIRKILEDFDVNERKWKRNVKIIRVEYSLQDNEAVLGEDEVECVVKLVTVEQAKQLEEQEAKTQYEFESLKEYKKNKENKERVDAIVEVCDKFEAQLGSSDEFTSMKAEAIKEDSVMTYKEVEDKCYSMLGRLAASMYESKPHTQNYSFDDGYRNEKPVKTKKSYEQHLKSYYKK